MKTHSPPKSFYFFINAQKNRMKTTALFLFTTFFLFMHSYGQIDKGTWLVGGTGNFSSSSNSFASQSVTTTSTTTTIKLSPNIAFFLIDKFALGLKNSFSYFNDKTPSGFNSRVTRFEIGPVARYYFLEKDKKINIVFEGDYLFGTINSKPSQGTINTYSLNAGPVFYFNDTVGLEVTFGYFSRKEILQNSYSSIQNSFQLGIGLQIHLKN